LGYLNNYLLTLFYADMNRNPRLRQWWDNNASVIGSKSKKRRLSIEKPTSSEEERAVDTLLELPKSPEVI